MRPLCLLLKQEPKRQKPSTKDAMVNNTLPGEMTRFSFMPDNRARSVT